MSENEEEQIKEILIDHKTIERRIRAIADEITALYHLDAAEMDPVQPEPLRLLVVMDGAFIFAADLVRYLKMPVQLFFVRCSSYKEKTQSSGSVEITFGFDHKSLAWQNKEIFVIEDIVDSGRTISALKERLLQMGVSRVRVVSLLDKPSRRVVPFEPDITGFTVPDVFVAGYGLDLAGRFRNLPFIAVPPAELTKRKG